MATNGTLNVNGNGKVRILVSVGGSWQPFLGQVNQIAGEKFHAILAWDVAGELRISGLDLSRAGTYAISPNPADQIGKLVDALNELKDESALLVAGRLRGKEADPEKGMSQVPSLGWMALTRELEEVRTILAENMMEYLRFISNGTVRTVEIHIHYGTGGGAGRGASRLLLKEMRIAIARRAPGATLTIRRYIADGHSWIGCGERVERNGATGAAQELCDARHDPYRRPEENQRWNMVTFPIVGTDKDARDMLVREIACMLHARALQEEIERMGSNDITNLDLGNMLSFRSAHYGRLNPEDVLAAVATYYRPLLLALAEKKNAEAGIAADVSGLEAVASVTGESSRAVEQVLQDILRTKGTDERFIEELLGVFTAEATVLATMAGGNGGTVKAMELLTGERLTADDLRFVVANAVLLSNLVFTAINEAETAERKANRLLVKRKEELRHFWVAMYGSPMEKVMAWRAWPIMTEKTRKREAKLQKAAMNAREAMREYALAAARKNALNAFLDLLVRVSQEIQNEIQATATALQGVIERGSPVKGITVKQLSSVLPDLLWTGSLPDGRERLATVLIGAVESVSMDTLARKIFGYTGSQPASARMLATLFAEAKPQHIAPYWGGKDRSHAKKRTYLYLPLSPDDLRAVKAEYSRAKGGKPIFVAVRCGAGVFIGEMDVFWIEEESDVVTPLYEQLLNEMAVNPTDLALSLLPDTPIYPDPRCKSNQKKDA